MTPKATACVAFGKNGGFRGMAINPQANEDRLCACQSTIETEQLYVDGGVCEMEKNTLHDFTRFYTVLHDLVFVCLYNIVNSTE